MKNQKKTIEIINQFPAILYQLKMSLHCENVDFILDATNFHQPVSLLTIAEPDMLFLNVHAAKKTVIDIAGTEMQKNPDIKKTMITANPHAYYMSLCSTLGEHYSFPYPYHLEQLPGTISRQQLN